MLTCSSLVQLGCDCRRCCATALDAPSTAPSLPAPLEQVNSSTLAPTANAALSTENGDSQLLPPLITVAVALGLALLALCVIGAGYVRRRPATLGKLPSGTPPAYGGALTSTTEHAAQASTHLSAVQLAGPSQESAQSSHPMSPGEADEKAEANHEAAMLAQMSSNLRDRAVERDEAAEQQKQAIAAEDFRGINIVVSDEDRQKRVKRALERARRSSAYSTETKAYRFVELRPIGISLADDSGRIVVAEVEEDLPAHEQGVVEGSVLRLLNGESVTGQSAADIRQIVSSVRPVELVLALKPGSHRDMGLRI